MKIPVSWLRDYVDIPWSVDELAERLTMSGLEVEGVERAGPDLAGIVAARIVRVTSHPNADRLVVCTVDAGGQTPLEIVCGAPNAREGDVAPLATPGCRLPGGMEIRLTKIRGVESRGMLCSGAELEVDDDASGLLILPPETAPGADVGELLGTAESVLQIEVTPNRPDCLSVVGIAREVASLTGGRVALPDAAFDEEGADVDAEADVRLVAPDLCPRYTARVLRGARAAPSPLWMRRRLEAAGLRSINSMVDVTNYVLLEVGQPLHAFDLTLLADRTIVVRRARGGERITVIDGTEHKLDTSMLVIADSRSPVALAGIMGGAESEIGEETSDVLIESAFFHPPNTRATSRKLGLSTESSYRFERGIDIEGVDWASRRAAKLMMQLCGGTMARGVLDRYPVPHERRRIRCRAARVGSLLGIDLPRDRVRTIFTGLGLEIVDEKPDGWTVEIPGRRVDLEAEVDLIEEVARTEGIDAIPPADLHVRLPSDTSSAWWIAEQTLRRRGAALGLQEIVNYSTVSARSLRDWGFDDEASWVRLVNPISEEQEVLRPSLLPGIVQTVARNLYHEVRDVRIFELGRVFRRDPGTDENRERRSLAIALAGRRHPGAWEASLRESAVCLFDLKGILQTLIDAYGFGRLEFRAGSATGFRDGACFEIVADDRVIGRGGELTPAWQEELRSPGPVAVAEVSAEPLLTRPPSPPVYQPLPRFPSVTLDVALVVDASVTHQQVLDTIRAGDNKLLELVELFDIFRSEWIGRGRKSLAYSLTYRDPTRSLTVEEANEAHARVKETLEKQIRCEIRQ